MAWIGSFRAAGVLGLLVAIAAGAVVAWGQDAERDNVFSAPMDPANCGERLIHLYDGDFSGFWNFIDQQGYSGAPEFAWSAPERDGETPDDWRTRAYECLIEVERANRTDDSVETRFAVGYFLWFGTQSLGFETEASGEAGVRERAYRLLRGVADEGYRPAREALIQAHLTMVRLADQRVAMAASRGDIAELPGWWPRTGDILIWLDRMAKTDYPSAFLAISTIYSERALLPGSTGRDHNGHEATEPDPKLIEAAKAYREAWRQHGGLEGAANGGT
jgi:hypothetical protein